LVVLVGAIAVFLVAIVAIGVLFTGSDAIRQGMEVGDEIATDSETQREPPSTIDRREVETLTTSADEPTPEYRTWTDTTGNYTVEAELLARIRDRVRLRRIDNGEEIWIRIDQLSKVDQEWIENGGMERAAVPRPRTISEPIANGENETIQGGEVDRGSKSGAMLAARQRVRNALRHPSEADFGLFDTTATPVSDFGDGPAWRVTGTVRAPNDFGVKSTYRYGVTLVYKNEEYDCVSCDVYSE